MLPAFDIVKRLLESDGDEMDPGFGAPLAPGATDQGDADFIAPESVLGHVRTLKGNPVDLRDKWKASLKGRSSLKLNGAATYLKDYGDSIALRYHNTDVVKVDKNNRVTVNTDGWHTVTTIAKVNLAAPGGWRLYGREARGAGSLDLYWCGHGHWRPQRGKDVVYPFTDGDVIEPDGTLRPQAEPEVMKAR